MNRRRIADGSEGSMKKCPKCGRLMVDEKMKSGRKWQIVWHCLCGHSEVDREPAETGD